MHNHFNKSKLPSPKTLLAKLGIQVGKSNGKGYFVLHCPFHEDRTPSLNLHSLDGHYRCWSGSCGAKGDMTNFYMRVTGRQFKDAVKDLGVWEGE